MPCRLIKPTSAVCVCVYSYSAFAFSRGRSHISIKKEHALNVQPRNLMRHILKFTGVFMLHSDQTHARLASRMGAKKKKKKPLSWNQLERDQNRAGGEKNKNKNKENTVTKIYRSESCHNIGPWLFFCWFRPPSSSPHIIIPPQPYKGPPVTWVWYAFCYDSQR